MMTQPLSPAFRGIPCTPEGLVWWRAHRLKELVRLEKPVSIWLFGKFHTMITRVKP